MLKIFNAALVQDLRHKMLLNKFRKILRSNSLTPAKMVGLFSLFLILLSWPVPMLFSDLKIYLFGIPLVYFYIIIVSPLLILFVTNWAVRFAEQLDRNQLETEND